MPTGISLRAVCVSHSVLLPLQEPKSWTKLVPTGETTICLIEAVIDPSPTMNGTNCPVDFKPYTPKSPRAREATRARGSGRSGRRGWRCARRRRTRRGRGCLRKETAEKVKLTVRACTRLLDANEALPMCQRLRTRVRKMVCWRRSTGGGSGAGRAREWRFVCVDMARGGSGAISRDAGMPL